MTIPYRKKLIEVALPLEAINVASAREKSIRHGHPSTLHLWWARRPLAACRAVLFSSLVDDPDSDPTFRKADGSVDEERAGYRRAELFNLIEELVQWENSDNESVINRARAEIAASVASRKIHDTKEWKKDQRICGENAWAFVCRTASPKNVSAFLAEHAPPVLDPFAGGGSIPLEAQRLGLRACASDLNPVAVLINKALIEFPALFANLPPVNPASRGEAGPAGKKGKGRGKSVLGRPEWRGAQGLADDVRFYGKWMREEAEKRIGRLYPKIRVTAEMAKGRPDLIPYVGEELTVIAWLWARTVASSNPAVGGAHVPLVRSFWVSTKKGGGAWVMPVTDPTTNTYRFEVGVGDPPEGFDPRKGTVVRTGGTCLISGQPMPFEHIRSEGRAGRMAARLMAIVAEGSRSRVYMSPTEEHERAAQVSLPTSYPETDVPQQALGFRVQLYGMDRHYKLFTRRQLTAMVTFTDLVAEARQKALSDAREMDAAASVHRERGDASNWQEAYADSVATYLAFAINKAATRNCTQTTWYTARDSTMAGFSRQAVAMTWDFAEVNPLLDGTGSVAATAGWVAEVLEAAVAPSVVTGKVKQLDAAADRGDGPYLYCTDPPYYDNIGYADLSDFFYIWLRRSLGGIYPTLFATLLTPKAQELIATPHRHGEDKERAKQFFENGLFAVFKRLRSHHATDYPLPVFYAFKQAESDEESEDVGIVTASTGWETMLEGIMQGGLAITATWPCRTEQPHGLRVIDANALASSIVLSCRPRSADARLATRREFLSALKRELPDALKHLQRGSIAPVDLAQAAIGPGMAVFTRYSKVMEADGSPMKVRQALALINQTLDEVLAEQEGEFDGDTRWALAWFEQFGMDEGAFGVAETLSKAKNTAVNGLVDAGLISARGGKVRLLKRGELPPDWNPATDSKVRHWEVAQHLIRALESGGEVAAAGLLRKVGGMGEIARDLAYRLYNLCERKKWPSEAMAYNGLVIAWPEITKLAQGTPEPVAVAEQTEMF